MNKVVAEIKRRNAKTAGTATVEAALILPMVMLAILAVLSIIRITGTYERMQHALNQVAEDLSQYSYLYAISGLKEQHDTLVDNVTAAQDELLQQQEAVSTFYQSIRSVAGNVGSFGDSNAFDAFLDTLTGLDNVNSSLDTLTEQVESVLEDPMGEVRLIGLALSDTLLGETKTALLGVIAKSMLKGRLSNDLNIPAREIEERLRLTDGIQTLDFSASTFFEDKETIDLILEYTVKPMPDFFFLPEIRLRNRACVLAWTWGVDRQAPQTPPQGESIWNYGGTDSYFNQNSKRGISAEDLYAKELAKKLGEHAEATPYWFKTVDVIEYAHGKQPGKLITVFSLNPFLNSYQSESAVLGKINQKVNEINKFTSYTLKGYSIDVTNGNYERIVYLLIPENEGLPQFFEPAFDRALKEADSLGVKLNLLKKYGEYTKPYQNPQESPEQ
jgi:Flp pilus assembly protein TadG